MADFEQTGQMSAFGGIIGKDNAISASEDDHAGGRPSDEVLDFLTASRGKLNERRFEPYVDPLHQSRREPLLKAFLDSMARSRDDVDYYDDHQANSELAEPQQQRYQTLDDARDKDTLAYFLHLRAMFRNTERPPPMKHWYNYTSDQIYEHMAKMKVNKQLLASLDSDLLLEAVVALQRLIGWHKIANTTSHYSSAIAQDWIFTTLARFDDHDQLDGAQISVLRDLAKKAISGLANRVKWMRQGQFEVGPPYDTFRNERDRDGDNDTDQGVVGNIGAIAEPQHSSPQAELDEPLVNGTTSVEKCQKFPPDAVKATSSVPSTSQRQVSAQSTGEGQPMNQYPDVRTELQLQPVRQIYDQGLQVAEPGSELDESHFVGKLHAALHRMPSATQRHYMSALCCLDTVILIVGKVYGQEDLLEKRSLLQEALRLVPE